MTVFKPRCRPVLPGLDAWPKALRAAWQMAAEPAGDLFGTPGRASAWCSSTRLSVEKAFSKLLSTLSPHQVVESDCVIELVTRSNLQQFVRHMMAAKLTFNTQGTYLAGIWLGANAMAPTMDWTWVGIAARTLRNRAQPSMPAFIPVSTGTLLTTAKHLFRQAWEDGADRQVHAAVRARDSLIMGSLAMRPLRRSNFCSLRLGEHVFPEADRIRFLIPANEMKMRKRRYAADWPEALAAELRAYLDPVRTLLASQFSPESGFEPAGDALWVSTLGTALSAVAIYKRVGALTAAQFGAPINLHRFRTIMATTLADGSPKNIHLATEVLGHADARSRDYYIRASGLIAARRSHASEDRQLREVCRRTKRDRVHLSANR
jgi:integrase